MSVASRFVKLTALLLVLCAAGAPPSHAQDRDESTITRHWAELLYASIRQTAIPPPVASRRIGYFGVALHESVVGSRRLGRALDGQLNGLAGVPDANPAWDYHWPEAANAAARRVLDAMFAGAAPDVLAAFAALEANHRAEALASGVAADVLDRSAEHGRAVADAIIAWAAGDGLAQLNNCPYTPPQGDGLWEPTPPLFRPALQPCWGQLRTFALPSGQTCDPGPPMEFSTSPDSMLYQEALLVRDTVDNLTEEQETIARFWSDDPGTTGTPPGHWLAVAAQLMEQRNLNLGEACELLARTGVAVADSFIACWNTKYRYNLLRPITYINDHIDPEWTPLLSTPPFPEYTSGHSTQSGAAASLMDDMLGPGGFTDHTHDDRGFEPRPFRSFAEAAEEAAVSRLYGGIHYDSTDNIGVAQGRCIADEILSRVEFDRCVAGDIFPNGRGDRRVGLPDLVLGWRKVSGVVALGPRDHVCGDLHPGRRTCQAGRRHLWCPEGDGRFTFGDFLVLRGLAMGRLRISCQTCVGDEARGPATSWAAGDVSGDGQVDISDAVRLLRASVGLDTLGSDELLRGDVAPILESGESMGDGVVNVVDVVGVLRASVGLRTLAWPLRTLEIVLPQEARRIAFSASIAGIPPWASVESWTAEGCSPDAGDGLETDGGTWDVTCVTVGTERVAPGILASVIYRGPRAIDLSSLTLTSELVDPDLAVVPGTPVLDGR